MNLSIQGPADTASLSSSVTGDEDTPISLGLGALNPPDSDEVISDITIGNVPTGAVLNVGNDNGDGTWTVPANAIESLTVTPPEHDDSGFVLTTSVTFTEGALTETFTGTVNVNVTAVIDEAVANVTVSDGTTDILQLVKPVPPPVTAVLRITVFKSLSRLYYHQKQIVSV